MAINTVTLYLSGYDSTDYAYASASDLSNPINQPASNNTYATINLTTGGSAVTYIYYLFDTSAIPDNAEIISMACKAKGYISTASALYISQKNMQLFSGDTAKGTEVNLTTTATEHTIDTGTWTREELNDCRLRVYASRASLGSSTTRTIRLYGAELIITYNAPELIPIIGSTTIGAAAKAISSGYVNIGGVWKPVAKSYANVNGIWLPTFGYRDTVYTWKKYNTVINQMDGWTWNSKGKCVQISSSDAAVSGWISRTPTFIPTYSNGELTKLSASGYGKETVTAKQMYNGEKSSPDYLEFLNPSSDWSGHGREDIVPSENYIYKREGSSGGLEAEYWIEVYEPIYNPTYTYTQGTYIEDVTSTNYTEYPDNGRHTDGYWYVKQS